MDNAGTKVHAEIHEYPNLFLIIAVLQPLLSPSLPGSINTIIKQSLQPDCTQAHSEKAASFHANYVPLEVSRRHYPYFTYKCA